MCAQVNMDDFMVILELMGNLQYKRQFAYQPMVFRESANPGLEAAIGDALALSMFNPKHLKAIGLMDEIPEDKEGKINFLYTMALKKVAFLPFGYLVDLWRWGVFSGNVERKNWNKRWWRLRSKLQGLCSPVTRTDADFDPASIYHVPANVPYMKYFVSYILQFQIHKYLCKEAGHTGPLYECDIANSTEAGQHLRLVLELGSSKPFNEVMEILTNGDAVNVDASAMLEYFEPLYDWLKKKNKNETVGWSISDPLKCTEE